MAVMFGAGSEEEAMVTDSDKAVDLDEDGDDDDDETEDDVDMMEESSEEAQGGKDLQDGNDTPSSIVSQSATATSQSIQRSSQSFSQSFTRTSIKSRSSIHEQFTHTDIESPATSSLGQTSAQISSTGDEQSETAKDRATSSTSPSVIQESTDPEPRLETPDPSPVASPLPLPVVSVVDQSECQMSPLRLQMTPSSADASVTVPSEKTPGLEVPVIQAEQETTPDKAPHPPLTIDANLAESSVTAAPESPSQSSPGVQTRSASKVSTDVHSSSSTRVKPHSCSTMCHISLSDLTCLINLLQI